MRNSYTNSAKVISILAVFSLLIVSSAAVMAQDQSAPIPTWTKCQTWAIRGESDLSCVAKDNLCTIQKALTDLGQNITIKNLDVKGQACSYIVFKVTDVTEDSYVLGYNAAIHMWAYVNVKMSGDFPVSGVYGLDNMKSVSSSVCGTANLCLTVTSCGTVTIEKSTMAIKRIVSNTTVDQSLSLKVDCTPSMGAVLNALNVQVTYNALNVSESLHLKLSDTIDFSPALPLLEFPMCVGNDWAVNSTMTVSGKISGVFKETGLPNSILSKIDENAAAFNGTLYLQDLPSLGCIPFDNGSFGPISVDLNTSMACVGVSNADQSCYNKGNTVFDVVESRTGTHIYYSPDTEFITGMSLKPQFGLESLMSLPTGSIFGPTVTTPTTTVPSSDVTTPTVTEGAAPATAAPSSDVVATSPAPESTVDQTGSAVLDQLSTTVTMVPTDPAVAEQAIGNITNGQGEATDNPMATNADTVTGGISQDSNGLLVTLAVIALVCAAIVGVVVFRIKKKNEP
ncbi:MAG TPA: hypothetical protein VGK23_00820 [Methanomassiliicoccales archaeon]|jgi:hypothetical protein